MSTPFLTINAWTTVSAKTRYPATGTYDLADAAYLGGIIGLDPAGAFSRGVATFFWTSDAAGVHQVGEQGMNLSSLIVSLAELRLMNRGPYLYITYEPFVGTNTIAAALFATNIGGNQPLLCGDTILVDEVDRGLAAHGVETIYPCDYFAGMGRLYFTAVNQTTGVPVADVKATVHGADLTDQFWPLDSTGPGSVTTILPIGTWAVVINNFSAVSIAYTLAITPLLS